ncbi:hypothetical protein BD410DRAFT_794905 [Rickenella mellea]|uniref:Uncharacterized protein n=1 Tax=Rickenella mellea TaxID=50990 RepID=A0A4Y7PMY9_9AGAM|nr:hypothetical protein BD410DRAFT_794905 [Rickenella mellea]
MALLRKSLPQRQQALEDKRSSTIRNILWRLKKHFARAKPSIPPAEELTGAQIVANPWDYMNNVIDISRQSGDPNAVAGRLGYTTPPLTSRQRESEHIQREYTRPMERLHFPLPPDYFKLAPDFTGNDDHPRMRPLPPIPLARSTSGGDWDIGFGEETCSTKPEERQTPYSPSPSVERKYSLGRESVATWISIPSDEPIPTPPYRRKAMATMDEPNRQDNFHSTNGAEMFRNEYRGGIGQAYVMGNGRRDINTVPFPPFSAPPPGLDRQRNNGFSRQHSDQVERSQSSCSHVATLNDDTESDSEYSQADHHAYLDAHDDMNEDDDNDIGDIAFEFTMLKADFEQQKTVIRTLQADLREAQRMIARQNTQMRRLTSSVRWLSSLTVFEEPVHLTPDEQGLLDRQMRRNDSALPPFQRNTHRSPKSGSPKKNIPSHVGPMPPPRFLENEISRTLDVDNTLSESDTMNDDDYDILKKPLRHSNMTEVSGQEQKFAQATLKPLPDVNGLSIITSNDDGSPSMPARKKMLHVPIYDTPLETPERLTPELESKPRLKVQHNYDDESQTRGVVVRMIESLDGTTLQSDFGTRCSPRSGQEIDLATVDDDVTPRLADFVKIGPPPRAYKSSGCGFGMPTPQDVYEQIGRSSGALKLRLLPDFDDMDVYQLGNEMNSNDSNVPYDMSTSSTLTWV